MGTEVRDETRQDRDEGDAPDDRRGSAGLPSISQALAMALDARAVRAYVRATMLEPAVRRLYDVGMGIQEFRVPTMAGTVVLVPASPSTQVRALTALIEIGVPKTVGLAEGGDGELEGVFALGPLELDQARKAAHGERYIAAPVEVMGMAPPDAPEGFVSNSVEPERPDMPVPELVPTSAKDAADRTADTALKLDDVLGPMAERIRGGEFELVEIDETADTRKAADDLDAAPPPIVEESTLEQRILARRRAERARRADPRRD